MNDIVVGDEVPFDEYKVWFEKYIKNNDGRETNIQNEVVRKFISAICADLDVEDVANKGSDSTKHDYLQYCGTYIDKGEEKAHTPDLVIAQNWNWLNKENNVKYCAVVEVKSPFGDQPIFNKEYEEYGEKLKIALNRHLSARNNDKLILTDALKWEFYKKNKEDNEIVPIQTFRLYDLSDKKGKWEWKKGEPGIKDNDVINNIFGDSLRYTEPIKEFEELKIFLEEFLKNGD